MYSKYPAHVSSNGSQFLTAWFFYILVLGEMNIQGFENWGQSDKVGLVFGVLNIKGQENWGQTDTVRGYYVLVSMLNI